MENNRLLWTLIALASILIVMTGTVMIKEHVVNVDFDEDTLVAKVIANMPAQLTAEEVAALIKIPEVVIPEVESADNELLNEYLQREFSEEYDEIEDAAKLDANEELEDEDHKVVLNYLKTLLNESGVLDEDSLYVDVEDVDVKVTQVGLDEDEDKCARVSYELDVEYGFEEGMKVVYGKSLEVVYDVCYDEGEFSDEKVSLVSIQ